jgi:hypothetical protein
VSQDGNRVPSDVPNIYRQADTARSRSLHTRGRPKWWGRRHIYLSPTSVVAAVCAQTLVPTMEWRATLAPVDWIAWEITIYTQCMHRDASPEFRTRLINGSSLGTEWELVIMFTMQQLAAIHPRPIKRDREFKNHELFGSLVPRFP